MSSEATQNSPTTTPNHPPVVRASHRFREIDGRRYLIANETLARSNFRELRTDDEKNAFFMRHFEKVQDLAEDDKSTSGTVINTFQDNAISFDTVTYSGLFCVVYGAIFIGLFFNTWIQRYFNISPRWMYFWNSAAGVFTSLWGMIGIWTHKIGYHNVWEYWFYQAWTGGASAGVQSYAAIVMAEVSPAPKMYIFFALFNTLGKTSGFIGPYIVSAITDDAHGNNNVGFYFTFFTGLVGLILLLFLDTDKAKEDNARYLEKEREDLYASSDSHGAATPSPPPPSV